MPSSPTPGSPTSICSRASMPTWPSPNDHRLGTPNTPAIRSTRAADFVASLVRFRYGLLGCSPPCTDRTGMPQPSGAFTSRLSTDRSPSPLLDITTTVTGLLLLAGLSPAGMAASLAARSSSTRDACPPHVGLPSDRCRLVAIKTEVKGQLRTRALHPKAGETLHLPHPTSCQDSGLAWTRMPQREGGFRNGSPSTE
jgi:hypothetical protein